MQDWYDPDLGPMVSLPESLLETIRNLDEASGKTKDLPDAPVDLFLD